MFQKIAAKAALRRKKAHERSLEQTEAQIGTLEQQINAIESANINRSTLQAMENASAAMKSIHGKLTPEKVDETMYVLYRRHLFGNLREKERGKESACANKQTGTRYASKTSSATKSSMPSRRQPSPTPSTSRIWRTSWINYNRSSWMRP